MSKNEPERKKSSFSKLREMLPEIALFKTIMGTTPDAIAATSVAKQTQVPSVVASSPAAAPTPASPIGLQSPSSPQSNGGTLIIATTPRQMMLPPFVMDPSSLPFIMDPSSMLGF